MEFQTEPEYVETVSEKWMWEKSRICISHGGQRFSGLPDAYIEVEEFDCLHDEGIAYGKVLARGGAKVQIEQEKGTFHGFDVFRNTSETERMIRKRSCVLRRVFYM